jgi:hypothetical protein
MKIAVLKMTKHKEINPNSQTPDADCIAFVDSDYDQRFISDIELPSIKAGDYLIYCKNEWLPIHTARKNPISVYGPEQVELKRVSTENFPRMLGMQIEVWANYRLSMFSNYRFPRYAIYGTNNE